MKVLLRVLIFILYFISIDGLYAQPKNFGDPIIPLQQNSSVLFGKDIIIHDQQDRNQRNIAICSAFNGWLFAVYSYPIGIEQAISVLRSTDNGINWELLGEGSMTVASLTTKLDIVVCGSSIDNLKIFVGCVYLNTITNMRWALVIRYNAEPLAYEDELLKLDGGKIKDLALASDFMYPSTNASPFSLGVLLSKAGTNDSIIFLSSSNGGLSLDSRRIVTTTSNYFHKVSLNYGRSSSWNSGRYFAAWEEQASQSSTLGHINTAHSNPNFNSFFTVPVCLDSLDPSAINKVRNPSIACQYNNVDNDSANLTEVVLFEKYKPTSEEYDVTGFYNLQATTTSHFRNLNVSATLLNELQPDINFNPFDSTFMVTYYDSTEQKLNFFINNFNLVNPNTWNLVAAGYNDNNNLFSPNPKVKLNIGQQEGMNSWIAEGTNSNGIALFDAPYSTYTGISETKKNDWEKIISVYPNPCSSDITFFFELHNPEKVKISLYNMLGHPEGIITDQYYLAGKNKINLNVNKMQIGCYTYTYKTANYFTSGIFIVTK